MKKRTYDTVIITSYVEGDVDIKGVSEEASRIICTDGGYDIAGAAGVTPDLLMGDFDSIGSGLPRDMEIIRFRPEKDYTDLELAVKKAADLGGRDVLIIGGMGGRMDHTIANIQILSAYSPRFSSLVMMDGRNTCMVLQTSCEREFTIERQDDSYLAFLSLSDVCRDVHISGVKYPLEGTDLTNTFPLGTSNEFTDEKAALRMKSGVVLAVISKKD